MLNSDQRTTLRVLSIGAAVVWVILGLSMGWPLWLWIGLAVVSLVAPPLANTVLAERALRAGARQSAPSDEEYVPTRPSPPPEPPQPQQYPVRDVLLQSNREDYQFIFACTVLWVPHRQDHGFRHANPGALAAKAILEEAAKATSTLHPRDTSWAEHLLASALGSPRVDQSGLVQAWANQVTVRLSNADTDRLNQLDEVRKDEDVWEGKCSYERKVRTYLSEDVLTTPGNAVVWWLANPRTDEKARVQDAVHQIDNLRQLTQLAMGSANPTSEYDPQYALPLGDFQPPTGSSGRPWVVAEPPSGDGDEPGVSLRERARKLVEQLPDDAQRDLFARQFADLLETQGHPEAADEIRQRFDAPSTDSSPPRETPEPAGDSAVTPVEHPAAAQAESPSGQHSGDNVSLDESSGASDTVPGEPTDAQTPVSSADAETVNTTTDNGASQQTQRLDDSNGLGRLQS